ncbi:UDP-glycosyltransferase 84B2-like [Rutidosis leptorrhynchoides]|uniref:UDP-glycosyltransferase 84B2-like n=1 Tax=Rutidosis leptorrhynchoides TaxID=125765 RepID=UPI003A9A27AB
MGNEKDVHVLIVTLPYHGHLNPAFSFAQLLISKGLFVTLATGGSAPNHFHVNSKIPRLEFEFFPDQIPDDSSFESRQKLGAENLTNLIKNSSKKFSCIIANPFLTWAIDVALKHEIPCAILWIQACSVFSIYFHYFRNPHLFRSLIDNYANLAIDLPGLPLLKEVDLPSFILPSYSTSHIRNIIQNLIVQGLDKVKWVLGNSFYELEEEILNSMAIFKPNIVPIGPLVSPSMLGKNEVNSGSIDSCLELWLDKKPLSSVIYISFGSMLVFSQEQVDNIATALKTSNYSFIWVIKPPIEGNDKKCGELSHEFMEATKERGLVVEWCPQEKILMHSSVACFMTHCGWNSTLESVVAGVPVIGYPEWADQTTDAKLLADVFKTGVRIRKGEEGVVSSEEIKRCIWEVTDGPQAKEFKKRAMELKEAANKAMGKYGSTQYYVDQFVNEVMIKSC